MNINPTEVKQAVEKLKADDNEILYKQIAIEIPELETARQLYGATLETWAAIIISIYRQGRVDQLEEWIKGGLKTATNPEPVSARAGHDSKNSP